MARAPEQRVAVRGGFGSRAGAERAPGTRPVLDEELLAELLLGLALRIRLIGTNNQPAGRQRRSRRIISRDPCRRTSRQRTTSFYTELSANLCEQVFLFAQFSFETCDGGLHRREFGDAGG